MLVKLSNVESSEPRYLIVLCIRQDKDDTSYELMNPKYFWGTRTYKKEEVTVLDDYIPPSWVSLTDEHGVCFTSFSGWAENKELFLQHLFWDEVYPEESKVASDILSREYQVLLRYYLKKYHRSGRALQEKLTKKQQSIDSYMAKTRGWEQPEHAVDDTHTPTLEEIILTS